MTTEDLVSVKPCRKCGAVKPLEEGFHRDRSRPDGRRNVCKACDSERKRRPDVMERNREYNRSERGKASHKKYKQSEKGKEREWARRRTEKFKNYSLAYHRAYYRTPKGQAYYKRRASGPEFREVTNARRNAWMQRPEVMERIRKQALICTQRRMAKKRQLPATFTIADWKRCLDHFSHRCIYCGKQKRLTQDHFIPLTSGGPYTPNNIVPACRECNTSKYNNPPEVWCRPEVYDRVLDYFRSLVPT